MSSGQERYHLTFFAPPSDAAACKTAVLEAGAGHFPEYSDWCFTTPGTDQFRPSAAARPHIGTPGVLEEGVEEVRIETVVTGAETVRGVVAALKK